MKILSVILIVLSFLVLPLMILMHVAPQEAAVIALACYFAILARRAK
jgi:hypothetical protein